MFVADDATTAATGLGVGGLLYAGVGAIVAGTLAMVVGIRVTLDDDT